MIALILLTTAQAEVTITHSVPLHHIAGEPFYVDLQLFNNGQQTEQIVDIGTQRWQVEFHVQTPTGTQNIHSTRPTDASTKTVPIAPRGLQEFRFEIPNAAAWSAGTIQLAINTPLNDAPFEQSVVVHPKAFNAIDGVGLENTLFTPLDTLMWTTPEHHLFKGFDKPQYIASLQNNTTFATSAHLGLQHHLYWMNEQSLTVVPAARDRLESPLQVNIPWPADTAVPLGQAITDADGQFLLPLWIDGKDSGTLYLLRATANGVVSFRKLYTGTKPTQCATGISQAGTPLVALSTQDQAWLLAITETGDPQVDSLPPKSTRIVDVSKETTIENLRFSVSNTHGLFLSTLTSTILDAKPNAPTQRTYTIHANSIQGSELATPVTLQTSQQFTQSTYLEDAPYFLNAKGAWDSTGTLVFSGQNSTESSFWRNEDGSLFQYDHTKQVLHRRQTKKNLGGKGE